MLKPLYLVAFVFLAACGTTEAPIHPEAQVQVISEAKSDHRAVIEIPAGTNKKMEWNYDSKQIEQDIEDGLPRVIHYLPYPGNYGFIPNTKMDESEGGDGDALDVLVIGESMPIGQAIDILPLGVLHLMDDGEKDDKILAIPADPALQVVSAESFMEFQQNCRACTEIIATWFSNYHPKDTALILGWGDETEARAAILKWRYPKDSSLTE